jgi:hypothetical protein
MATMSTHWRIEVALSTAPYAVSQTYTDITTQVRALNFSARRGAPNDPTVPQVAEIVVDNRDGRWSGSSTYASAPYAGNVVPDRRVRLSVRASSSDLFEVFAVLFIESVDDSLGPDDATATLRCSDLFRLLAQSQPVTLTRPAELPGPRVKALLDAAGVPSNLRTFLGLDVLVDNGTVMLAPANLNGQVLGLIHDIARCEQGQYGVLRSGEFFFYDRYHWIDASALNTSQVTFDEDEFLRGEVVHSNGAFGYQRSVVSSALSGRERPYSSTYAPANFPNTTRQELGTQLLYDADAEALAELVQKQHETVDADQSNPEMVELFVASPSATNAAALAAITTYKAMLGSYVSLTYRPIGWSADRDAQCRVELHEHEVTPNEWRWRLGFSPADHRWRAEAPNHFYQFGTAIVADHRGSL